MRFLALLGVRNEIRHLDSVLTHLVEQGAEVYVIDNGSTDGSREVAEHWLGHGIAGIEDQPWTGLFELATQLRIKERIAHEHRADWYLHVDADERRYAPPPYGTLAEGLADVDARGFNAVDFDEFVFSPTVEDPSFNGQNFEAAMRWYYHYEPDSPDRMQINAWKRHDRIDLVSSAGHHVRFAEQRVFPRPFVMRHYPILSVDHAAEKYGHRIFAADELVRDWHSDRARFRAGRVRLPSRAKLHEIRPGEQLDPSDPWDRHPFLDPEAGPKPIPQRDDPDGPERQLAVINYSERHRAHVPVIPPVAHAESRPLWSVMFPVCDPHPDHLIEALQGVLNQDPGPSHMELVVLDDASTTDVRRIVSGIAGSRVDYVRHVERQGLAGNWNAAIARARGLLVHLHHQDDVVIPGFYERLGRPLVADPGLVAAYCRVSATDANGRVIWSQAPDGAEPGIVADLAAKEAEEHRMMVAGVVVRRSTYELLGGYRDDLPFCTDWDLLKRVTVLGPVWYEPLVLAHWRSHPSQETARLQAMGADLVDRRRSIELTATLMPVDQRARVSSRATNTSIVSAVELLRQLIENDALDTAVAQAREILTALEVRRGTDGTVLDDSSIDDVVASEDHTSDRQRIAELEAQLKGWATAVRLAQARASGAQ